MDSFGRRGFWGRMKVESRKKRKARITGCEAGHPNAAAPWRKKGINVRGLGLRFMGSGGAAHMANCLSQKKTLRGNNLTMIYQARRSPTWKHSPSRSLMGQRLPFLKKKLVVGLPGDEVFSI